MNIEALKRNAEAIIRTSEESLRRPVRYRINPPTSPVVAARRILTVLNDIYPRITSEEIARIKSVPIYQRDMRCCKDIKEKYGLSWREMNYFR